MADNTLYYGDNLEILRRYIQDESVDLIYLDPPFKSNQDYNVLFQERNGSESAAQIKAFDDTWRWDETAKRALEKAVESGGNVSRALQSFRSFLGETDMMAYLSMMAPRLVEMRRVMKPTASIYLHCDPTASHYLKILMDAAFGSANFRNEIVWHYRRWPARQKNFQRMHDVLLFYSMTRGQNIFTPRLEPLSKGTLKRWRGKKSRVEFDQGKRLVTQMTEEDSPGRPADDVWDIPVINSQAKERLGYPTQKPEALLERIITASSNEGHVVLDPFCGCGTAVVAAQKLKRKWIGMDIARLAITLIKHRIESTFGKSVKYSVVGEPVSLPDAQTLAQQNRYHFQWWALDLVGARPTDERRGADRGIDGRIYFHDETGGRAKPIVISVKSGGVSVKDVRDLRGVVEREKAQIGVLISLQEPTKPMRIEATTLESYQSPWGRHPRLQILTVEELLAGKGIDYPRLADITLKKAPRHKRTHQAKQIEVDLSQ